MWTHTAYDELMIQARTRETADGLVALGVFVTGRPCFVAHGGIALRRCGDTDTPVTDSAGNPVAVTSEIISDPSLDALDVEFIRVSGAHTTTLDRRSQIGGLIWRAGVLLKMLDTAFAHLSKRESGGQKTLQHQLVKATFTECFSLAEQVRLEAPHWLDSAPDFAEFHGLLNAATTKAAKLMGGHGYLRGSLNSLECLSLCVSTLLSDAATAQTRAAA